MNPVRLTRFLGSFSLGLGALEVLAPGRLGRSLGLPERTGLLRLYGWRELAAGVGLLMGPPRPWLWARVAGDALDIATLLTALGRGNPRRAQAGLALASVLGVTALDILCTRALGEAAAEP